MDLMFGQPRSVNEEDYAEKSKDGISFVSKPSIDSMTFVLELRGASAAFANSFFPKREDVLASATVSERGH